VVLCGAGFGRSRTCSSCDTDVSTEFLESIVRPALTNWFLNDASSELVFPRRIGGAVRLLFHDAGAFDAEANTGRPNGCLLRDDPGNAGIEPVTVALTQLFDSLPKRARFSRADFWQYAGLVAIDISFGEALRVRGANVVPQLPNGSPMANFRVGRRDAPDCGLDGFVEGADSSLEDERFLLPPPEANFEITANLFARMGLTVRELVAVSGAHTLGSARGSGHSGQWVTENAALDNDYYATILDAEWRRQTVSPEPGVDKFQWQRMDGTEDLMMLNTDLALAYQVDILDRGCQETPSCLFNRAGRSLESRQAVVEFAGGEERNRTKGLEAWYGAFIPALVKLGELGYTDDDLVVPCELPAECRGGFNDNSTLARIQLTLLIDDEFRQAYHATLPFRALIIGNVAEALDIDQVRVLVDSVRSGSVIVQLSLYLDPIGNAQQLNVLRSDDAVLRILQGSLEDEVEAGLVGPIRILRSEVLHMPENSEVTSANLPKNINADLLGPFQSQAIDAQNTLLGTILTAAFVVVFTSIYLCFFLPETSADDLERQEREAKDERKRGRLAALAPKQFSADAQDLAYKPDLDFASSSSSDEESGGSANQDEDEEDDRERKKKRIGRSKRNKHKSKHR